MPQVSSLHPDTVKILLKQNGCLFTEEFLSQWCLPGTKELFSGLYQLWLKRFAWVPKRATQPRWRLASSSMSSAWFESEVTCISHQWRKSVEPTGEQSLSVPQDQLSEEKKHLWTEVLNGIFIKTEGRLIERIKYEFLCWGQKHTPVAHLRAINLDFWLIQNNQGGKNTFKRKLSLKKKSH